MNTLNIDVEKQIFEFEWVPRVKNSTEFVITKIMDRNNLS
jgi:hypothetical protein